ncbi:MAG: hypothetical protein HY509_04635 [Acidobacteria bacterium]|nr:hypothetical protein [Acidobacteriota bacterium]
MRTNAMRRGPGIAPRILLLLATSGWALGCGGGREELPPGLAALGEEPAGAAALEAIHAHGGWSAWTGKEAVEYDFQWTPYSSEGIPGVTSLEHHRIVIAGPRIQGRVERPEEDLWLGYNGILGWAARDRGMRADLARMDGAEFYIRRIRWIFRLPFNLVEVNVQLQDEGTEGGLHRIKVAFPTEEGAPQDEWARVYLDAKTGRLRDLYLNAARGRTWMEFLDHREVDGILVPLRRRIHQVTPEGGKGALSHEVEIRDVRFNVPLDSVLFDPPEPIIPQIPREMLPAPPEPPPAQPAPKS